MTEKNHCYEKAMAERVNNILKEKFMPDAQFTGKSIALKAVKEAMATCNTKIEVRRQK